MRCVADLMFRETGKDALTFETPAGLLNCWKGADAAGLDRRHGQAALRLERDSARRGVRRHALHRVADRADRQSDPAFALGAQHGQSARDLLGRRRDGLRPRARSARCWKTIRSFPERANISLCAVQSREHIVVRTWERGAGLTRACGSAACAAAVAAARLRKTEPQGDRHAAGRRPHDRMARARRSRADDRAGRATSSKAASIRRCSRRSPDERRRRHLRLPAQHLRVGGDPQRARPAPASRTRSSSTPAR